MLNYILVGLGGAIGSILRVIIKHSMPEFIMAIPCSIMFINVLGCFGIGALSKCLALYWTASPAAQYFIVSGFFGGFTTFSSFALEFGTLVERHHYVECITYAILSVGLGLGFFFIGFKMVS